MKNWKFSVRKTPKQNWARLMAKAQRIRLSGGVNIEHNMPHYVDGVVQGDHGTYNVELAREDPQSTTISQWRCTCPWFQYAWDRTEKYEKYEGRFCSHALALFWESQQTAEIPISETVAPAERDDSQVLEEQFQLEQMQSEQPTITQEIIPPEEPQMTEEEIPEYPVNYITQPEQKSPWSEVQEEEEIPENVIRNSKVTNIQNMNKVITLKDMLKFKQTN